MGFENHLSEYFQLDYWLLNDLFNCIKYRQTSQLRLYLERLMVLIRQIIPSNLIGHVTTCEVSGYMVKECDFIKYMGKDIADIVRYFNTTRLDRLHNDHTVFNEYIQIEFFKRN